MQLQQTSTKQRSAAKIESLTRHLPQLLAGSRSTRGHSDGRQFDLLKRQLNLVKDFLAGRAFVYLYLGAQYLMTLHHLIEAAFQRFNFKMSGQPHGRHDHINRSAWLYLLQEPEPLLRMRKRNDLRTMASGEFWSSGVSALLAHSVYTRTQLRQGWLFKES